jgi:hypothetical protein
LAFIGALLTKISFLGLFGKIAGYIFAGYMMKKLLISTIAMFYLTVSSGLAMNIHYCMGKISSVSFGHEANHNDGSCSKCGMSKTENHCCNDETQFVKLTDDQQVSKDPTHFTQTAYTIPVHVVSLNESLQGSSMEPYTDFFSPPPPTLNKVYLAVNVLRI